MAKLIINPQTPSRKEIDLPEAVLSIGRDPANDVVIQDALVSRRHAQIVFEGGGYLFHDCESANGSLLNGDRVVEKRLSDGDVLWLGASRLLFQAPELEVDGNLARVIRHPSSKPMRCASCDLAFHAGDVFCRNCGLPIESDRTVSRCPSCSARVVGPARFCNSCGESLADHQRPTRSRRPAIPSSERGATHLTGSLLSPAAPEKRLLAALVDLLAAGVLFALLAAAPLVVYLRFEMASLAAALLILPLSSFPAYFVGFWAARGATPGKELLGLVIVMKDSSRTFDLRSALVRFAGFCMSLATLGLGFMMILIDGDTLHDGLAGTYVVERRH